MKDFKDSLYIAFGSRTGNAKAVAVLAHEYAQSLGYASHLQDMQEMDYSDLTIVKNLLVVVSTHGEGEPPVQAEDFYEYLHSDAIQATNANYAVLGLGDSSYRYFCQTGEDIDKRLGVLGGTQLMDNVKCDIDFEELAKQWVLDVMAAFKDVLPVVNDPQKEGFTFELKLGNESHSAYKAQLLEKRLLTSDDSSKKVLHVSLSLKNSGIDYQPGDALGVYGTNSRALVDELLLSLGFDKAYPVKVKEETRLLKELLINDYELTLITPVVIKKYAAIVDNQSLNELIADDQKLENYAATNDILDLVMDYPGQLSVEEFLGILRSLSQRLYSLASSSKVVGDQADITVKIIENSHQDRMRNGVCSSFLWNRLDVGDMVPVTLETIAKFRLPETDDKDIIMISAGTGIAPFRAFLQERDAQQSKGNNWLIFGERNSASDYLYQDELEAFHSKGMLQKLSTVFSRDQEEKRYVSHLIEKEGEQIMKWIEKDAILYVCGSKDKLAVSVRESLLKVIACYNNCSAEDAMATFEELKARKQYQEEVY
ncbi:MAG: flavodoxin domain-containing protein [Carboxylicivirga sp.]|jgi:sulfite reductase (NADPH) flavoprotein alpha-component|nr:flavodoxin domain-containing protein [Carboxylicivirga sp.]